MIKSPNFTRRMNKIIAFCPSCLLGLRYRVNGPISRTSPPLQSFAEGSRFGAVSSVVNQIHISVQSSLYGVRSIYSVVRCAFLVKARSVISSKTNEFKQFVIYQLQTLAVMRCVGTANCTYVRVGPPRSAKFLGNHFGTFPNGDVSGWAD